MKLPKKTNFFEMMTHEESDKFIESELENCNSNRVGITTLCVIGFSIGGGIFI